MGEPKDAADVFFEFLHELCGPDPILSREPLPCEICRQETFFPKQCNACLEKQIQEEKVGA
jgi:hypothetical protein